MTRKLDLKRAADLFRISIEPDRLAEIESALRVKIDEMEVYEDELLVVKLLQQQGVRFGTCSNPAAPYSKTIKRLYPMQDAHVLASVIATPKALQH